MTRDKLACRRLCKAVGRIGGIVAGGPHLPLLRSGKKATAGPALLPTRPSR
jgi:hypothetical protein